MMRQKKFADYSLSELKYEYIHTSFVTMRNFKQVVQNVEKTYTISIERLFSRYRWKNQKDEHWFFIQEVLSKKLDFVQSLYALV